MAGKQCFDRFGCIENAIQMVLVWSFQQIGSGFARKLEGNRFLEMLLCSREGLLLYPAAAIRRARLRCWLSQLLVGGQLWACVGGFFRHTCPLR